jgi:glycosyltransferase involved in cell wall biosynthesis
MIVGTLSERTLNGVVIITSAFVFNELYNQRVINLSKYLAGRGWGVIYVAWRWSRAEEMQSIGEEVYKNIFQIPVDMFLENLEVYSRTSGRQKYFITEFPHPDFFSSALRLRRSGFKLVYEIIDEWEEFHKAGQALWFNKAVENAFVVNANFLTAVSQPLIEKFSGLRRDIHLSPNGYTPSLLGEKRRGISLKKRLKKSEFHLGYFGHLTESWFDWDFLLKVLDLAHEQGMKLYIHLIGYGEPDIKARIEKYSRQVKFYGKVHPSKLYKYVKSWDAAMICFKSGKLSEAVDPIKIYEYLYFGLPVIVKGISHLKTFPLTQVVADEKQAVDALVSLQARGRRLSAQDSTARERVLAASIWEQRFTDLLEIMENEKWMFL